MCSAVSIMGAVQVLQEVFGLLSSTLTEAKDFIAKCHFGISLAITLPVMVVRIFKFQGRGTKLDTVQAPLKPVLDLKPILIKDRRF